MSTDYRALCAELIDALAEWQLGGGPPEDTADADLIARARAELVSQPEPEGAAPTDKEIDNWHSQCADSTLRGAADHYWAFELQGDELAGIVRAALARWGTPAIQPIVVPSSPADSLVERIATDTELCQAYNNAPEHGFGSALRAVYDLGRQHGAAPIRSAPELPLVERVARLIANFASEGLPGDDATPTACAAILEVAAWFRTERDLPETAAALEQEANR
jgi:hypothetical protein